MAAGDETVMGPFDANATGMAALGAAMDTAWDGTDDKYVPFSTANGLEVWCIHIEGQ